MEERAPPPMDDGNVRRNSVSGQNIEEFTETYEQKKARGRIIKGEA